jgi:hypothetical protein
MANVVSTKLVKELREALALAEQGKITDGVIVAIGTEISHHGFAVEKGPHRLVSLLGEMGLCHSGLENMLITERMEQAKAHAAGIVGGRPRLQG